MVGREKPSLGQISFLIACGTALQLAEGFFLSPLPGVRLGLANIASFSALVLFGPAAGFEVACFRPIITSLTNGTFLSPIIVLNFFGSITGFAAMTGLYLLMGRYGRLSMVIAGMAGGLTGSAAQILIAYGWLVPHFSILFLLPVLIVPAIGGGYLVGWYSHYVWHRFEHARINDIPAPDGGLARTPVIIGLRDKAKILAAFALVLSTVFIHSVTAYLLLIALVGALIYFDENTMNLVIITNLWAAIAFSFILPAVLADNGTSLWRLGIINITAEGLIKGLIFSLRLTLLILISVWMGVTRPEKLSEELAWVLSPLRVLHFSVERIPRIFSISLSFVPVIWDRFGKVKPKTPSAILDSMVAALTDMRTGT